MRKKSNILKYYKDRDIFRYFFEAVNCHTFIFEAINCHTFIFEAVNCHTEKKRKTKQSALHTNFFSKCFNPHTKFVNLKKFTHRTKF